MKIIHSIAILVALAIPSLIANSSISEVVISLAGALEDNTYWPKFQIYTAETTCMHLENIILVLVTITRVEGDVIKRVI